MTKIDAVQVGWRLGTSMVPRGVDLWVRYDRTTGVYGAQGSGKTLDLLAPALIAHRGAAMVTLTKLDDLLLTMTRRQQGGRPVVVLDRQHLGVVFQRFAGQQVVLDDELVGHMIRHHRQAGQIR